MNAVEAEIAQVEIVFCYGCAFYRFLPDLLILILATAFYLARMIPL